MPIYEKSANFGPSVGSARAAARARPSEARTVLIRAEDQICRFSKPANLVRSEGSSTAAKIRPKILIQRIKIFGCGPSEGEDRRSEAKFFFDGYQTVKKKFRLAISRSINRAAPQRRAVRAKRGQSKFRAEDQKSPVIKPAIFGP